MHHNNINQQ